MWGLSSSATRNRKEGEKEAAGDQKEPSLKPFVLCLTFSMAEYLFGCIWFVWFHSGSGGAGVPFQCPPCSEQLTLLGLLCSENTPNLRGRSTPNSPAAGSCLQVHWLNKQDLSHPTNLLQIQLVRVHYCWLLSLAHQARFRVILALFIPNNIDMLLRPHWASQQSFPNLGKC